MAITVLEDGWFKIGTNPIKYRVQSNLWYIEQDISIDSEVKTVLNYKTMLLMYLGMHCKMYDIEYSISTLKSESEIFSGSDKLFSELTITEEGWIIPSSDEMASILLYTRINFIIKYNDITISNTLGEADFLKDLYVILDVSDSGIHNLSGWREQIQPEHVSSSYLHSHLPSFNFVAHTSSSFCTGHNATPINKAITRLSESLTNRNLEYLNNILKGEECNSLAIPIINNFEAKILSFLNTIPGLITHESLQGVPHIYLRYNYMDVSEPPYDEQSQQAKEFAIFCCQNISDKRISYNISNDVVKIIDNSDLVNFAKEHDFFYKIFAYPKNVGTNYTMSLTKRKVISPENLHKIECKLNMLCSPFRWNGQRITAKLYEYKNNFKLDDNKAKLHDNIRGIFDIEVANFFKGRLLKYVF